MRTLLAMPVIGLLFLFSFAHAGGAAWTPAKVRSGDTVYSILKQNGFNQNQRNMAIRANPLPDDFSISPKDTYFKKSDTKTGELSLRFYSPTQNLSYVFWRKGSALAGAKTEKVDFQRKVEKASGKVRGSLVESISHAAGDDLIAYRFMDAFLLDYNLPKLLQRNAAFSLTFERLFHDGVFVRNGEVLKASIEIGGETVERTFQKAPGGGVFLDSESHHSSRPFYSPVNYIRISSLFQPRRFHPIKKYRKAHAGVDFELPEGAPILSIGSGQVLRLGRNRAAGNFVVVRHSGGYESYYNHMRKIDGGLKIGKRLNPGDRIGEIGCTGYCTKAHLHFAIKKNGQFINPVPLLKGFSFPQRTHVADMLARQ